MPKKNKNDGIQYNITDAEWKIMKALWKQNAYGSESRMSLGEILEILDSEITWNMNTVKTLLVRLAEKEIIKMEKAGQYHKYYALAKETDCAIQETKSLVKKVFGGSTYLMFSALLKDGDLQPEEKAEILSLIESIKE